MITPRLAITTFVFFQLLAKVLRYCSSGMYHVLRQVSKRWDHVVDQNIGRACIIKLGSSLIIDHDSELDDFTIKTNFWTTISSTCVINENDSVDKTLEPTLISSVSGSQVTEISNPGSIHKLGVIGKFSEDYPLKALEKFLTPCVNVTGLYLHFSFFASTTHGAEDWSISLVNVLPNLRELVIDSNGMSNEESDSDKMFDFKQMLQAVGVFLMSQNFPHVTKFVCRLPYMESCEGLLIRGVATLLGNHSQTIKSFSFHQTFVVDRDDDSSDSDEDNESDRDDNQDDNHQQKDSHDQDVTNTTRRRGSGDCPTKNLKPRTNYLSLKNLADTATLMKKVSLEEFHVLLVKSRQESAPVWKNMIVHQGEMRKCIYAGDKMHAPLWTLEANSRTLVTLRLDLYEGIDLKYLQNCSQLKHLSLCGKQEAECDFDLPMEEDEDKLYLQLKNSACLPSSLQSIEIINLRTLSDDAHLMSQKLPKLTDLSLKNVGWEVDLGLHLLDLAAIWNSRRLHHLLIKASLNMLSLSEVERTTVVPPELNLIACTLLSSSLATGPNFSLEVWKTKQGTYTTLGSNGALLQDNIEMPFAVDVFQIPNGVKFNEEEEEDEDTSSDEQDSSSEEEDAEDQWQDCENQDEESDEETESPSSEEDEDGLSADNASLLETKSINE